MRRKALKVLKYGLYGLLLLALCSKIFIPAMVFRNSCSTLVLDDEQHLIAASIADDGQWRFPISDSVPYKFEQCILQFEDRYFYYHPGVNPVSIIRALIHNIKAGRIVEGGSTLSMQVSRLYFKNAKRSVWNKLVEVLATLHLELNQSKKEILNLYAYNAPFGGNVVGLETASWRYYGRSASSLSWSESAALAVLPNAPSLIYPGKNQEILLRKRNKLLAKLKEEGIIDEQTYQLSLLEELPGRPVPLPETAPHVLDRARELGPGKNYQTTINRHLQKSARNVLHRAAQSYYFNEVYNIAALIIDNRSGEILTYVGNNTDTYEHQNAVDIIKAPRSTGSVLKPLLFAEMITKGELLPKMLLTDIPTHISGYAPTNYYDVFDGVVPANEALYRSLNVPFVRLLQDHGVHRFHQFLQSLGLTSLNRPSNHYGLSLILGGGEARLQDLCTIYAGMAHQLSAYDPMNPYHGSFAIKLFREEDHRLSVTQASLMSNAAIYETFSALTQARRPIGRDAWRSFHSSRKLAWKTGTSYGNKDAWAIGVTPEYTVGVWVGNADGEGRSGLTGLNHAAPVLFDLIDLLPATTWFQKPHDSYELMNICAESGLAASLHCSKVDTLYQPIASRQTPTCSYHVTIHLDEEGGQRVHPNCYPITKVKSQSYFVLPAVQEWYYKQMHPQYKKLPDYKEGCQTNKEEIPMEFIYPKNHSRIFIPKELEGGRGSVVFEIAHKNPKITLYWHLNKQYIGHTRDIHQMEVWVTKGNHQMLVVDAKGMEVSRAFRVLSN